MYTWRVLGPLNAERIWSHSPILILWFLKLHLSEIDKIYIYIYINYITRHVHNHVASVSRMPVKQPNVKEQKNKSHGESTSNAAPGTPLPGNAFPKSQCHCPTKPFTRLQILSDPLRYLEILSDPFRSFQCFSSHPRTDGFYGCRMVLRY